MIKKYWNKPITWGSLTTVSVLSSVIGIIGTAIYTDCIGLTDFKGWIKKKLTKNSGKEEEES